MANKHLKLTPHNVNENWWWYEENKGIVIVHRNATGDTKTVDIHWRSIRNSLKRKDRKP